jgi:hypothetical protein
MHGNLRPEFLHSEGQPDCPGPQGRRLVLQYRNHLRQVSYMQHVGQAVGELRREFLRKGGAVRDLVRDKRCLLLTAGDT